MKIFKIGGSVITDKAIYRKAKMETIERIAGVLSGMGEMVIVHGGGSFGHIKAREFGFPGRLDEGNRMGVAIVHRDMVDLNSLVSSALIKRGVPAVPFSIIEHYRDGAVDYSILPSLLRAGLTPVLFGDTYVSGDYCGIYSGDRIMRDLAEMLRPEEAVFMTDVDGIFESDPKRDSRARLIPRFSGEGALLGGSGDVTGGMRAKVKEALEIKRFSGRVVIMNGNFPERLLQNGAFLGTVIE